MSAKGSSGNKISNSVNFSGSVMLFKLATECWISGILTSPFLKAYMQSINKTTTMGNNDRLCYQFDLDKSFIAVFEQVTRLSRVDTDNTEKQLAGNTQSEKFLFLGCNGICNQVSHVGDAGDVLQKEYLLMVFSRLVCRNWDLEIFLSQWEASQTRASGPRLTINWSDSIEFKETKKGNAARHQEASISTPPHNAGRARFASRPFPPQHIEFLAFLVVLILCLSFGAAYKIRSFCIRVQIDYGQPEENMTAIPKGWFCSYDRT